MGKLWKMLCRIWQIDESTNEFSFSLSLGMFCVQMRIEEKMERKNSIKNLKNNCVLSSSVFIISHQDSLKYCFDYFFTRKSVTTQDAIPGVKDELQIMTIFEKLFRYNCHSWRDEQLHNLAWRMIRCTIFQVVETWRNGFQIQSPSGIAITICENCLYASQFLDDCCSFLLCYGFDHSRLLQSFIHFPAKLSLSYHDNPLWKLQENNLKLFQDRKTTEFLFQSPVKS